MKENTSWIEEYIIGTWQIPDKPLEAEVFVDNLGQFIDVRIGDLRPGKDWRKIRVREVKEEGCI